MTKPKAPTTKNTTVKSVAKKTVSKVNVKKSAIKPTAKAPIPQPVAKNTSTEIRREIENINQISGIGAKLSSTQSKNRGTNNVSDTDKILAGISKKLDIIIDLLKLGKDM